MWPFRRTSQPTTRETSRPLVSAPDRDFQLRAAASWHSRELLFGGVPRKTVLERIRAKAPDFPEFLYKQQLDDSVALTLELRRSSVKRRKEAVSTALQSDVLNAVFDLRFFNVRFASDEKMFYGLEPIDIRQALCAVWAAEDITSAVHRADALLSAGARFSWCGGEVYLEQQRQIAEAHPGYTPENLREALGRGFFLNR